MNNLSNRQLFAFAVAFAAAGTAPLAPPFAEDAQQHAMSIIDTARKGEGE